MPRPASASGSRSLRSPRSSSRMSSWGTGACSSRARWPRRSTSARRRARPSRRPTASIGGSRRSSAETPTPPSATSRSPAPRSSAIAQPSGRRKPGSSRCGVGRRRSAATCRSWSSRSSRGRRPWRASTCRSARCSRAAPLPAAWRRWWMGAPAPSRPRCWAPHRTPIRPPRAAASSSSSSGRPGRPGRRSPGGSRSRALPGGCGRARRRAASPRGAVLSLRADG